MCGELPDLYRTGETCIKEQAGKMAAREYLFHSALDHGCGVASCDFPTKMIYNLVGCQINPFFPNMALYQDVVAGQQK